jgi:hypothetical protein
MVVFYFAEKGFGIPCNLRKKEAGPEIGNNLSLDITR